MSVLNIVTVEQALLNSGHLDGAGRHSARIISQAKYAVKQTFARLVHTLTEKQIIWAYEQYMDELDQAEAEGYGCPNA